MKKLFILFLVALCGLIVQAQNSISTVSNNNLSLIPYPSNLHIAPGTFIINSQTVIIIDGNGLSPIAGIISEAIRQKTGFKIAVKTGAVNVRNSILLSLKGAADTLGNDGYTIAATSNFIKIAANNPKGIFYAAQTLEQLMPVRSSAARIPCVNITDKPRFNWRGSMLDCGRYFYSVDFIKKYLDLMAMYKLNTFHWHLTEDHGWRIEIKKYPKLTQIGAWRAGTQFDRSPNQIDKNPHGGYYTQEQIKEIVAYAAARYINVVPEIEMPGHSLAALVAYPELSCTGGPFKMPVQWGIQKDVYCAGNEQTFKFLEDVLTEIIPLFPSPYIHIGGDECPKDRWKLCPKCQAHIKAKGLKDEHELQSYFIKRIEDFLLTKNKRIIGWDEILEGGLAPNATVMSWRGIAGGIAAAKLHHDVIMTPSSFMYFDYYQGEPYQEPVAIGGLLTLQKVYDYNPVPDSLPATEAKYIKGLQANIWSEYIHSPQKVEYMAFPRLAAMAEVAWTEPALKNWEDFKKRMETEYQRYDQLGINYSKSAYNVWQHVNINNGADEATITLTTDSYKPQIHYTTDGSEPTLTSQLYTHIYTPV
ncbi:beta-N-acetylhexosaminidase [Mucilaginibacter boryungensis]|uniref:beta-N-acetylhexosaminidase n=1 Tax=Mucilaginibacter boryungensis TaxID=768480 RepID=UPI001D167C02|nr:family 20 glycosylhydrolase [Mucilaginibacter boryungensis]